MREPKLKVEKVGNWETMCKASMKCWCFDECKHVCGDTCKHRFNNYQLKPEYTYKGGNYDRMQKRESGILQGVHNRKVDDATNGTGNRRGHGLCCEPEEVTPHQDQRKEALLSCSYCPEMVTYEPETWD
jgi:hypothetical protein